MIKYCDPSQENIDGYLYCEIDEITNSRFTEPFLFRCVDYTNGNTVWETSDMSFGCWSVCSTPVNCESKLIDSNGKIAGYWKWVDKIEGNKYDYIEIGTSDFETLVEVLPDSYKGLSIEPIKHYLENLPDVENNQKLNFAISDKNEIVKIYLVEPEDIKKYNLPDWIKGCNSINSTHPSVLNYLYDNNLLHIYKNCEVESISFENLVERYNITEVDYLKIDTEGHDFTIIRNLLKTKLRPKKIRCEANSLYKEEDILKMIEELKDNNYVLMQRTQNDIIVRYKTDKDKVEQQPILVLSTGRRLNYFHKTIKSLFDFDKDFSDKIKFVWLLDDRSSDSDRFHMEKLMKSYFGDKWSSVYFNDSEPYRFVEKFRFIKNIVSNDDIVFLLEDDWLCSGDLSINYHINNLINSDWTQISFTDPLEIQEAYLQKEHILDFDYWKNPYPDFFRHPHQWNGDICYWNACSINNYTNNPSLIKGSVFHTVDFEICRNFECEFAETLRGKHVFTHECFFRHFGYDSLIDNL